MRHRWEDLTRQSQHHSPDSVVSAEDKQKIIRPTVSSRMAVGDSAVEGLEAVTTWITTAAGLAVEEAQVVAEEEVVLDAAEMILEVSLLLASRTWVGCQDVCKQFRYCFRLH